MTEPVQLQLDGPLTMLPTVADGRQVVHLTLSVLRQTGDAALTATSVAAGAS